MTASAVAQSESGINHYEVASVDQYKKRSTPPAGSFYHPYVYRGVGTEIVNLPSGSYHFKWGPYSYYYAKGVFYQAYANGRYKITAPPIGAEVPSLPIESEIVMIDSNPYYVCNGIYYDSVVKTGGEFVYKVVGRNGIPPRDAEFGTGLPLIGDMTDRLPEGCRKVVLRGGTYWITPDDVYLEKVEGDKRTSYRVVAIPEAD
ncbi:MAG TPA: hypothetical protein ENO28_13010 [Bacteroidetes bacterium]|nr:hypothetical protein [Bacteroidota bacterium]